MKGGIKSAMITRDNLGRPEIAFTLDRTARSFSGGSPLKMWAANWPFYLMENCKQRR